MNGNTANLQGQIDGILGREGTGNFEGWYRAEGTFSDYYVQTGPFDVGMTLVAGGGVSLNLFRFDPEYARLVSENLSGSGSYGGAIIPYMTPRRFAGFNISNVFFIDVQGSVIQIQLSGAPTPEQITAGLPATEADAVSIRFVAYLKLI